MSERLSSIAKSNGFQNGILILILMAAILVGLETSPSIVKAFGPLLDQLNNIILWLFVIEAAVKMGQHGRHFLRYFKDPWNVFDFLIVVICFLPIDASYAAVFRMARVVRALRLVTALPKLQLIVNCLLKSIPSMFYVGVLLSLTFYVYAVLGVFLFRENDPVHFRNLPTSLLTLFRVVTLEDWTDVMYIQMLGSGNYAYPDPSTTDLEYTSTPQPVLAVAFFVSFVVLATMIMLNLFIGVILSSMTEAQDESDRDHIASEKEANLQLSLASEVHVIEREVDELKLLLHKLRLRLGTEAQEAAEAQEQTEAP